MEQLLNVHRASMPSPSSDGSVVAFLSDIPGLPQPYRVETRALPAAESTYQRILEVNERIHFVRFAPHGQAMFFGRDHGGDENVQLLRATPLGAPIVDLTAQPAVRTMFGTFSDDGRWIGYATNERSRGDFDVYVRGTVVGEPRRVLEASGHFEAWDFSGDGRWLIASEEHSGFNNELHLVDVAAGTRTHLTPHQGDARYINARFSRDGRTLWVLSDVGRDYLNVATMSLQPGVPTFVLDESHDVDAMEFSRRANVLAIAVNVDGWHQLRLYDASDPAHLRALTPVDLPPVVVSSMEFSEDGRWLVLGAGRASLPDEVFRVNVQTGHAERVTRSDHAGIEESSLVDPTVERVRSFDGLEIPVLLYRPRGMRTGERAPVVVWVHGGPEGQATPSFSPVIQFLVGHGYVVAAPNVRGSTGYGKRYAHLDDVALREDSVHDLAEVNRWLRTRPDVFADRIAVMGGSYGGYMTLAAITLYPDLWAAACDIVGIANFRTFLERTAAYRRALREAEYGTLARDGAVLDRVSPIHRVDRITAPLMVIHGANDPRVPIGEAEQIVAALRARSRRVEYIRFENEGHGIARRENKIRAYGDLIRFFDSVMTVGGT